MKNKSLDHGLSNFRKQGIRTKDPQSVFELTIPAFKFIRNKGLSKTLLRWEDDGGQIIKPDHPMVGQKGKNKNA